MAVLYVKRNKSWLSTPFNLVLRSYVDDGERTESTHVRLYWRYEDEPLMTPQFWRDGEVGFETAGPIGTARDIRLYLIGFTELDVPTDKDFILAEQKVVHMVADSDAVTFAAEEVTFDSDLVTFAFGSSSYVTFAP